MTPPPAAEVWLKLLRNAGVSEQGSLYAFSRIHFSWMARIIDLPQRISLAADTSWASGKLIIDNACARMEACLQDLKSLRPTLKDFKDAATTIDAACKKVPSQVRVVIDEEQLRVQLGLAVAKALDELVERGVLQRAIMQRYEESARKLDVAAMHYATLAQTIEADLPGLVELVNVAKWKQITVVAGVALCSCVFFMGVLSEYLITYLISYLIH